MRVTRAQARTLDHRSWRAAIPSPLSSLGLCMATGHADDPRRLPVGLSTMHIEHNSSNRIEKPLGTGVSAKHALNATIRWRRSTNEPKGTAQGNRGSATQGGDRASHGLLPFNVLALVVQRSAHDGVRLTTVAAIAAISSFALVRESAMTFMHFTLACAVVAFAVLVHVAVTCTANAITWSRAGID